MKILAVNGSPRGKGSNSDRMLLPFLDGAGEAGAEVEVVYLSEKKINHCLGCFACWTKEPGVCVHKDDMPELLEKIKLADIIVYTTPLYVFTVTGLMKDFMDRHLPLTQPYITKRGDQYIHPRRYEGGTKKIVLISNCGYPERHHFSGLVETFRCFTSGPDKELAAVILCAAGELLRIPEAQGPISWYFDACKTAGRELVNYGKLTPETQALLNKELIDPELFSQMVNSHWREVLKEQ